MAFENHFHVKQLLQLTNDTHTKFENKTQTHSLFLTFSKAFDRVPHIRLIAEPNNLKVRATNANWISSFLTNRSQHTVVDDLSSPSSHVTSADPQGRALGPLLFLSYIKGLPEFISSNIRLFADDCIVYHATSDKNDHLLLQSHLTLINDRCYKWQGSQ